MVRIRQGPCPHCPFSDPNETTEQSTERTRKRQNKDFSNPHSEADPNQWMVSDLRRLLKIVAEGGKER